MYERHRTTLGALHLVLGLMNVIAAAVAVLVLGGVIALAGDPDASQVLGIVMTVVAAVLCVAALPALFAGAGLLGDKSWARTAAIVSAFLNLTSAPFGTAVAVYTLWAVFHGEHREP